MTDKTVVFNLDAHVSRRYNRQTIARMRRAFPLGDAGYTERVFFLDVRATATAAVAPDGTITEITVVNPGSGYNSSNPPIITIEAPSSGTQATATATVSASGTITGFTITEPGTGYDQANPPTVTIGTSRQETIEFRHFIAIYSEGQILDAKYNDGSVENTLNLSGGFVFLPGPGADANQLPSIIITNTNITVGFEVKVIYA